MGSARNLGDLAAAVLEATVTSEGLAPRRTQAVRNWLARYVGKQSVFGLTLNFEALRADAPNLATERGMLEFLGQTHAKLERDGGQGLFLVLDDLNGICAVPEFARFVKTLIDLNAMAPRSVPLLLMLCGVEERRREMIRLHEPVARTLDVVEVGPLRPEETARFFAAAFGTMDVLVEPEASQLLTEYSGGFPKIVQAIGDAVVRSLEEDRVTLEVARRGVHRAAADMRHGAFAALRSRDYRSILAKIAGLDPDAANFRRADVAAGLTPAERRKLDDFLRRMTALHVLRPGDERGEYVFLLRLVRLYIRMQTLASESTSP